MSRSLSRTYAKLSLVWTLEPLPRKLYDAGFLILFFFLKSIKLIWKYFIFNLTCYYLSVLQACLKKKSRKKRSNGLFNSRVNPPIYSHHSTCLSTRYRAIFAWMLPLNLHRRYTFAAHVRLTIRQRVHTHTHTHLNNIPINLAVYIRVKDVPRAQSLSFTLLQARHRYLWRPTAAEPYSTITFDLRAREKVKDDQCSSSSLPLSLLPYIYIYIPLSASSTASAEETKRTG